NIRCNRSKPLLRRLRASSASSPPGTAYIDQIWHTYGVIKRFFSEEVPSLQNARQQQGGGHFDLFNRGSVPIAVGSRSVVLVLLANAVVRGRFDEPARLAATVTVALLANAFVCDALSGPHDRYGARMVWIATFTAAIAVMQAIASLAGKYGWRGSRAPISARPTC